MDLVGWKWDGEKLGLGGLVLVAAYCTLYVGDEGLDGDLGLALGWEIGIV